MTDFAAIADAAHAAGMEAGKNAALQLIAVKDGTGKVYDPFPICGFGWVHFAGNTAWGRWAKANIDAVGKGYPTGLDLWVRYFNQSYDQKLAYARAYAAVLNDHGIDAYGAGRLD